MSKKIEKSIDLDNRVIVIKSPEEQAVELETFFEKDNQNLEQLGYDKAKEIQTHKTILSQENVYSKYVLRKSALQTNVLSQEIDKTSKKIKKVGTTLAIIIILLALLALACSLSLIFVKDENLGKILSYTALISQLCTIFVLVIYLISVGGLKNKIIFKVQEAIISGLILVPKTPKFASRFVESINNSNNSNNCFELSPEQLHYCKVRRRIKAAGTVLAILAAIFTLSVLPIMIINQDNTDLFKLSIALLCSANTLQIISFIIIMIGMKYKRHHNKR